MAERESVRELPKLADLEEVEEKCRKLWESEKIYRYHPEQDGEIFSIDTPPPYVSAAHLHVGHAMSYTQAEFVVRYQRMRGRKIFYPMGFDDNGLPTERYVERKYQINKRNTTRSEFRALCIKETQEGAKTYEELWRALGLSVDWTLRYSTIDEHCRRTSQASFIDLYEKGHAYRADEPVLWDTHFETALSQADLESTERKTKLNDIVFHLPDGQEVIISTTRPELLPACVALYFHPADERYRHLLGKKAVVPIFGQEVPVRADDEVLTDFGSGLMMVCTFGDSQDVARWKRDGLETRLVVDSRGKLTEEAGEFAGMPIDLGRKRILEKLDAEGLLKNVQPLKQSVSVSDRSGVPAEFLMARQWFIRVLDLQEEMLERSRQLRWHPDWMQVRLEDWVRGLKYDWNISRQRFYGVPFPVWYCAGCEQVVLAPREMLPVDPIETPCPVSSCAGCGGSEFVAEEDVMDTWMTSSLTPLINANWVETPGRKGAMDLHPMTVRVQAFEIIRTWLFYTLVKSHLHCDSLPWTHVMISGWGLSEQGKKISKRDLEKHTDQSGYNRYEPYSVIRKFGADALRCWAAKTSLGHDSRYSEREVKEGRRLTIKLWNAARFSLMNVGDFDPRSEHLAAEERTVEDRWLLARLQGIVEQATSSLDAYDYAKAFEQLEKFFWATFCDDYLEMVKDRFWNPERYPDQARRSAQWTLWEGLRTILGLFAPYLPFVTEELYQQIYRPWEEAVSIHVTPWPAGDDSWSSETPEMELIETILKAVRSLRTEYRISQTKQLSELVLDLDGAQPEHAEAIRRMEASLQSVSRATAVRYGEAEHESGIEGVRLQIVE